MAVAMAADTIDAGSAYLVNVARVQVDAPSQAFIVCYLGLILCFVRDPDSCGGWDRAESRRLVSAIIAVSMHGVWNSQLEVIASRKADLVTV